MPPSYVVDTNILLGIANPSLQQHLLCKGAVLTLQAAGSQLHYTLQNAAEFWNASTRPRDRNGYGLTSEEVAVGWGNLESVLTLLPDDASVYAFWRGLVAGYNVRGVQVHDAKLAAAMLAHSVPCILTLNTADFDRYPGIQAVHPGKVHTNYAD